MNLSPQRLHVKEVEALLTPGGSGSGDEDDPNKRKPKKKSRSPLEKPCTSSEEERLVKSSDEEKSENYGTFGASTSTPKKKSEVKPTRGQPAASKQPTEMEGSAVHGRDVFSFEEEIFPIQKFSPVITRSRKFSPGSPPRTVLEKSSETEVDTLTGAIPKKRVEGKPKSGSKSPSKHKSPESATSKTEVSQQKLSAAKLEAPTPEKSHKTDSKPKSTFKSPRKAVRRCLSYLRSPKEESLEQERTRPRTRSQSKKATTEERKTETKIEPKPQPKTKKQIRERSSSKSTQPADKKSLISAVDKSDSDSSPHISPRKTRKRRDPLLPSLFGKPIEDVCDIVKKSDSDSGDVIEQSTSDFASGDTGDKLLSPLARLSTDPETDKDQDVDFMSVSEEEEGESGNDPSK